MTNTTYRHTAIYIYIYIYIYTYTYAYAYAYTYTIYNIQYTIYNIQYTIYNIQYTIYNINTYTYTVKAITACSHVLLSFQVGPIFTSVHPQPQGNEGSRPFARGRACLSNSAISDA